MALQWFEPSILDPPSLDDDHWMNNYGLFISKLKKNFSPYDPKADAKTTIEGLVMHNNHCITKYIVEFYHLAVEIN